MGVEQSKSGELDIEIAQIRRILRDFNDMKCRVRRLEGMAGSMDDKPKKRQTGRKKSGFVQSLKDDMSSFDSRISELEHQMEGFLERIRTLEEKEAQRQSNDALEPEGRGTCQTQANVQELENFVNTEFRRAIVMENDENVFWVGKDWTVLRAKELIRKKNDCDIATIVIKCDGKCLKNDARLTECPGELVVVFIELSIILFRHRNDQFGLACDANETIGSLRQRVADKTGLKGKIILVFRGSVLRDSHLVETLAMDEDSYISVSAINRDVVYLKAPSVLVCDSQ